MSAVTERAAVVEKGPRFWREGDAVMFQFVIDGGNVIGPRPAVKADSEKHAAAWIEFLHAQPAPETVDQVSGQPEGDAPRRKARLTVKAA